MKKVKNILISIALLVSSSVVLAQQESIITLYKDQMNLVNPAYAGVDERTDIAVGYRQQWIGVKDAPVVQTALLGFSLGKNVGIGLSIVNSNVNIENQTFVGVDFSYKLIVNTETDLYFGIKAGGNFYDVNTAGLQLYDGLFDAALNSRSTFNPNIGVGALLKMANAYVSLSVPRILNTERARLEEGQVLVATDRPHFYLSAGYDYDLGNRSMMVLKPSFMVRQVTGATVSIDTNLAMSFLEAFEIGAMYRISTAAGATARINISKNLLLGYAYEVNTKKELTSALTTHEFLLKYRF